MGRSPTVSVCHPKQQSRGLLNYRQFAYSLDMRTLFFETSSFTAMVGSYLTDDEYRLLQSYMLQHPETGDLMPRTGVVAKGSEEGCGLSIIGL